jgi:WD40 repeat protein
VGTGANVVDGAERAERRRIEIVHESLLTKWPRLVHWQTQDAEGAQFRDELRQAAHLWHLHNRSQDFLWTGAAYREYQVWRERYAGNLTEVEEAFVNAITAHARRRRRLRLTALATLVALAVVIAGATTFLWQRAETEARRATAAKLLALGQLQLDSYPTAALAYATKSLEVADSEEARRFAVKALWRGPTAFILPLPQGSWFRLHFSPNGEWLATSSFEENVLVLPSSGGRSITLGGHETTGGQRRVEFGPRSDLLVTKTFRGDPARIWSIPEGKLLRRIDVQDEGPFIQRAGQVWMFFRRANTSSRFVQRWSLPDGPAVDVGSFDATDIADFDVDATGTWLALARGRDVLLRSIEFFKRGEEQLVGTHSEKVASIAFGPKQRLLSRDAAGEIRVWSLEGGKARLLRIIRGASSEQSPQFDRTGSRVAAANPSERMIRVWDIDGPAELAPLELRRGDADRIAELDFATTRAQWLAASNITSISVWPLMRENSRVLLGHLDKVSRVRFSPNGSWIATGSFDGTVRIWPLDGRAGSGSRIVLRNDGGWTYGLAVDPSGKRFLASYTGLKAFLGNADGEQPPRPLGPGVAAPFGAAFDHSGHTAALGSQYSQLAKGRIIRIWDVETGDVVKELDLLQGRHGKVSGPYDGGVFDMEFAPDGSLYSAGSGGVRKWDVEHGTSQTVVEGNFMTMDLTEDGRHLLTATSTTGSAMHVMPPSTVQYHDLATKTSRTLASHGSEVVTVALDPTGTIAVTGSSDGTIRVGRVTGEDPHMLFGHEGNVMTVAVSPDGHWIASGGNDGTVRVWPMPDLSKPPLHSLPHEKLLAKLRSLTNLRVIEDVSSPNGYKLDVRPFPGWEKIPEW